MTILQGIWKRSNGAFCDVFLCKENVKRDVVIISIAILASIAFIMVNAYSSSVDIKKKVLGESTSSYVSGDSMISEEEIYQEVRAVQDIIDESGWKKYQSNWYGFEVSYPETGWDTPKSMAGMNSSKWEYRLEYRKDGTQEGGKGRFSGFDVVVYNLAKVKELSNTDEFPKLKESNMEGLPACDVIDGHIIETGDYPAEEIYVSPTDECYRPSLLFSFTKGDYIYNLIPVTGESYGENVDPRIEIMDNFPEFFSVASTLKPIDIVRPEPAVIVKKQAEPNYDAPKPVSYRKVDGKKVCAKKHDNPSKSKKNKGKHLDMECCLDPDEYPNPWCHYDPNKYGKYL